jgi:hypothetical protein
MIASTHILLFLTYLLPCAHAFSYFLTQVPAHTSTCFHETLKIGERLDLTFQVAEGGHLDIDFRITSPLNKIIYSVNRQSTATYGFNADVPGKHTYCFDNSMSTFAEKQVSFTVMV